MKYIVLLLVGILFSCTQREGAGLKISYSEPAEHWSEALPLSNGSWSAMVDGGVFREKIILYDALSWKINEIDTMSLQEVLESFRTMKMDVLNDACFDNSKVRYPILGCLYLNFEYPELDLHGIDYERSVLDDNGVLGTSLVMGNVRFSRRYSMCSSPNTMVLYLRANKPSLLNLSVEWARGQDAHKYCEADALGMNTQIRCGRDSVDLQYTMQVRAWLPKEGSLSVNAKHLKVSDATEVYIFVAVASSHTGVDYYEQALANLDTIVGRMNLISDYSFLW